ncbi:MAG: hypothetical protein ACFFBY_16100 [Promethearchaeota archaeon]
MSPRISPAIASPLDLSTMIPISPKRIAMAGMSQPIIEKIVKMSGIPNNKL